MLLALKLVQVSEKPRKPQPSNFTKTYPRGAQKFYGDPRWGSFRGVHKILVVRKISAFTSWGDPPEIGLEIIPPGEKHSPEKNICPGTL